MADMKRNIKYITELKQQDLNDIANATNPVGVDGIQVEKKVDAVNFGIDKQQLKLWMWTFYHNGGFAVAQSAVTSVPIDYIE